MQACKHKRIQSEARVSGPAISTVHTCQLGTSGRLVAAGGRREEGMRQKKKLFRAMPVISQQNCPYLKWSLQGVPTTLFEHTTKFVFLE